MTASERPRILVAGQTPPPHGGQNVMIARILAELGRAPEFRTGHLAFRFTPAARAMRRGSARKLLELVRVVARLLAARARGRIELLLFPAGGPQDVPILRDLLLLPWILLCARRVVVQFHAAGIAARLGGGVAGGLGGGLGLRGVLLRALYRRCDAAVVMTASNRCDPLALGIRDIAIIPHRLPDEFDPQLVRKIPGQLRLLYVGHLCPEKGTPELLRAFREIAAHDPGVVLELVGEVLPPLPEDFVESTIRELGLTGRVEWRGVLTGPAKQEAFGRADLFVFPSVAPYESFGLVMVEAMMWGLPIVATDWRGNREVLGAEFEGICHPVTDDLAHAIAGALGSAIATLRAGGVWSGRNRQLFLARYRYDESAREYARHAARWLGLPA